jgi:alanine dehydrogenase
MKPGSVIVDVAVDQGGCIETIKPTTHDDPTYLIDGIVHYGVANMPGAVPNTSTIALSNATLRYALELADKGLAALDENPALRRGLNAHAGMLTYAAVGEAFVPAGRARACAFESGSAQLGSTTGRNERMRERSLGGVQ